MTTTDIVRFIGLSHLLQPPLTLLLASRRSLDLRRGLVPQSRLAAAVAHNMAVASVALPTSLGLLLAWHANAASVSGCARDLALLLAGFWSWRLFRQLGALGADWPPQLRAQHRLLLAIFALQGPLLGGVLWWTR